MEVYDTGQHAVHGTPVAFLAESDWWYSLYVQVSITHSEQLLESGQPDEHDHKHTAGRYQ